MIIRNATSSDLPSIITMGAQLQEESKKFEPLLVFSPQVSYEYYTKELKNDHAILLVACHEDGTLMGYQYSYLTILDYLSANNRECIMEALYVRLEFRRMGVAKALLRKTEQWAIDEMKADRIKAGIYAGNDASEKLHLSDSFRPYYVEYIKHTDTHD